MTEIQSLASVIWWLPYLTMVFAVVCFAAGLVHAYRGLWLWLYRGTPISNPVIAKGIEGVKPPLYALYATIWLIAGIIQAGFTIKLWQ